jgi:hypothetical protein
MHYLYFAEKLCSKIAVIYGLCVFYLHTLHAYYSSPLPKMTRTTYPKDRYDFKVLSFL